MTNSKEQTLIKSSKIWIVDPIAFSRFCYQYGLQVNNHGLNRSSFFGFNSLIISTVFVTDLFKQFDKSREQIVKVITLMFSREILKPSKQHNMFSATK